MVEGVGLVAVGNAAFYIRQYMSNPNREQRINKNIKIFRQLPSPSRTGCSQPLMNELQVGHLAPSIILQLSQCIKFKA